MKYIAIGVLGAVGLAVLASCKPISEESCRAGNWAEIGLRDGSLGASTARIASYQEECAKFGISPDRQAWLDGREEGLKTYCTPRSAYLSGKRGRGLTDVCPNPKELRTPNVTGLRYHEIDERIDDLKDRKREIISKMHVLFSGELTKEDYFLRQRYLLLLDEIESDIDALKYEQRRLRVY